MFKVRTRPSENIEKRQKRSFLDITGSGCNIPLEGINWLEHWCSLPITEDCFKKLYEFQVKDDDVYVVTFPKCGTTWTLEMSWLLVNNVNIEKALREDIIPNRCVFIDLSALYTSLPECTIDMADRAPSPRVMKTHLPAHLLPKQIWEKKAKIIYCARNPKDMFVSFFHFHRGLGTWQGDINDFLEDLINNDIMYSPYWDHLIAFWLMRKEKNIFFTTYEEMKKDLRTVLINLNTFLEKPQLNEKQLEQLEHHLSFDYMKTNERVNPTSFMKTDHPSRNVSKDFQFMRRGIVGSYKDELTPEVQKKLDVWITEHLEKFNIKLEDIFEEI